MSTDLALWQSRWEEATQIVVDARTTLDTRVGLHRDTLLLAMNMERALAAVVEAIKVYEALTPTIKKAIREIETLKGEFVDE